MARAKAEILDGLAARGTFVFNADDRFADLWRELAAGRTSLSFGVRRPADVASAAGELRLIWNDVGFTSRFPVRTPQGELDLELALAGAHNRMNALAATAAALAAGRRPGSGTRRA